MQCNINSETFGKGTPRSLIYLKDNAIIEKKFDNMTLPYSILLFKRWNTYNCVVLDTDLAKSLIARLYFFEGKGLKYIQPFIMQRDVLKKTQIYVYKINWDDFVKK